MRLGIISRDFLANNMKKKKKKEKKKRKTGLNGYVYNFSIGNGAFDTTNIIDIHKYLMKKYDI